MWRAGVVSRLRSYWHESANGWVTYRLRANDEAGTPALLTDSGINAKEVRNGICQRGGAPALRYTKKAACWNTSMRPLFRKY